MDGYCRKRRGGDFGMMVGGSLFTRVADVGLDDAQGN